MMEMMIIFEGDSFIIEKEEFNKVNRSDFGRGSNHLYDILEYHGQNCYIPTGQNFFLKCINYLTGKDYKNEYFEFINSEGRRKNVMTLARIQPFCKKYNINIGIYKQNEKRILPRTITEKSKGLYLHKNHFCVIWISNGINFSKAVEELELNFKYVNNKVTDDNVTKFKEYKFNPNKVDSQLNNVLVYDIETYNKERAIPYAIGFYPVSKIVGKWNRDLTQTEIDKCLNDIIIFKGENCISCMFDYLKSFKGEPKYTRNNCGKVILSSYELKLIAHNGSGFDSWIILNNLPKWCSIVSMIKTGKGIISLKILNGIYGL